LGWRRLVQVVDFEHVGRYEGVQSIEFLAVLQLFREHDLADLIFNGHGLILSEPSTIHWEKVTGLQLHNRSPKKMDDFMEQSIRNEIPGTVKEIISDKVLSEIIVETRIGEMAAVITTRSVQDMGLKVGDRVAALVKATNVSLRRQGF
jgi:molybdopterin-binding protein